LLLAQGPYSRTTTFVVTPQVRVYLGQIKVGLPRNRNETEQVRAGGCMPAAVMRCCALMRPLLLRLAVAPRFHSAAAH
jgi:hypothetical protein